MQAIILSDPERPDVALLPIAGRPLIARQIQWLRAIGATSVAVEVGANAAGNELSRWLGEDDALGAMVNLVLAGRKLDPVALATRAGLSPAEPLLVVPGDVLGAGDPRAAARDGASLRTRVLRMQAPEALEDDLRAADVTWILPSGEGTSSPDVCDVSIETAWAVHVRSHADALCVAVAAIAAELPIRGADPVPIHASEREPGIWIARGARVDEDAVLSAPVLIGAGAVVSAGARVGPRAFVGDRAVVPAGSMLRDAVVMPGAILGEGLRVERAVIDGRGMLDLLAEERVDLDDPLLAATRDEAASAGGWIPRVLAAAVLVVSAPLLLLASAAVMFLGGRVTRRVAGRRGSRAIVLHEGVSGLSWLDAAVRLVDLASGTRSVVGLRPYREPRPADVSAWLYEDAARGPYGVLTIDDVLTPPDATACDRLRARLWYAHAKSPRTDLRLLASRVRASFALPARAVRAAGPRL
jgi:carbonic anhydrase/acetyltransferase-like protein (isoleucine patch superfamily)